MSQTFKFSVLISIFTQSLIFASYGSESKFVHFEKNTVKGYFLSVDGLGPTYLKTLSNAGLLNAARGLGWIYGIKPPAECVGKSLIF